MRKYDPAEWHDASENACAVIRGRARDTWLRRAPHEDATVHRSWGSGARRRCETPTHSSPNDTFRGCVGGRGTACRALSEANGGVDRLYPGRRDAMPDLPLRGHGRIHGDGRPLPGCGDLRLCRTHLLDGRLELKGGEIWMPG